MSMSVVISTPHTQSLGSVQPTILSNPHPHTHPGYLGKKNIIRIILNDQGFSRFYKKWCTRVCVIPRTPVFRRKVCFWSVICLVIHTLAQFIPPGMLQLMCAIFLMVFFNSIHNLSSYLPMLNHSTWKDVVFMPKATQQPWISQQWCKWGIGVCVAETQQVVWIEKFGS